MLLTAYRRTFFKANYCTVARNVPVAGPGEALAVVYKLSAGGAYVGQSIDFPRRIARHLQGRGSRRVFEWLQAGHGVQCRILSTRRITFDRSDQEKLDFLHDLNRREARAIDEFDSIATGLNVRRPPSKRPRRIHARLHGPRPRVAAPAPVPEWLRQMDGMMPCNADLVAGFRRMS